MSSDRTSSGSKGLPIAGVSPIVGLTGKLYNYCYIRQLRRGISIISHKLKRASRGGGHRWKLISGHKRVVPGENTLQPTLKAPPADVANNVGWGPLRGFSVIDHDSNKTRGNAGLKGLVCFRAPTVMAYQLRIKVSANTSGGYNLGQHSL